MFATASLAKRIERAEAGLARTVARAAAARLSSGDIVIHEMHGGVAAFVEPGSPYHKAAGFGFDGVPSAGEMDAQGVQGALLRHRLNEAARHGCDVGVVTTTPGSTSQANVQKAGCSLLYARAILVLPPQDGTTNA